MTCFRSSGIRTRRLRVCERHASSSTSRRPWWSICTGDSTCRAAQTDSGSMIELFSVCLKAEFREVFNLQPALLFYCKIIMLKITRLHIMYFKYIKMCFSLENPHKGFFEVFPHAVQWSRGQMICIWRGSKFPWGKLFLQTLVAQIKCDWK